MISIFNILTIAKYETQTLIRSWFFRIFAILALLIYGIMAFTGFAGLANSPWSIRGMSSIIPYVTVAMMNIAQAVLAVFLSSDFIKRDKKLDTSEVIFARSMSNADYVFGKTLGNLYLFFGMTIVSFIIGIIANLLAPDVSVHYHLYPTYLLLISVPTLLYIFGLVYVIMILTKNQAITYLITLSYVAATLFYIQNRYGNLFDFMGFFSPMNYSDFTGFANINQLIIQRGIYLLIGLGCISFTVAKVDRLFQSKYLKTFSYTMSVIFLALAGGLVMKFIENRDDFDNKRTEFVELNNKYAKQKRQRVLKHDITLEHNDNTIESKSKILVKNENSVELKQLLFSLNPSLKVSSTKVNGNSTEYRRDQHLLFIELPNKLTNGDSLWIEMEYSGTIDESYMYLDIENEKLQNFDELFIAKNAPKFEFLSSQYVLLTNEAAWYPVAGVSYSTKSPSWYKPDFSMFTLKVKSHKDNFIISQGTKSIDNNNEVSFRNEQLLPEISLIIGDYVEKSVKVDSIDYKLLTLSSHNYYEKYLEKIKDTLPSLISELQGDYERKTGIKYPFKTLSLIEVPVHYRTIKRLWTNNIESVQPEMVFLPENAITIREADFARMLKRKKRNNRRKDEDASELEMQIEIFNTFVNETFYKSKNVDYRRMRKSSADVTNYYNLFPTYYSCSNYIESENWTMFNSMIEIYLQEQTSGEIPNWVKRWRGGVSVSEKANLRLQENSFEELFSTDIDNDIMSQVIELKSKYLLTLLKKSIGEEELKEFIFGFVNNNRYKSVSFEKFNGQLISKFNFDLEQYMQKWYKSKDLPSFEFSRITGFKSKYDGDVNYVIQFKIENSGDVDGMVTATISGKEKRGRRGRRGRGSDVEKVEKSFTVEANTTRKITLVLENKPKKILFNTLTSNNIPSEISIRIDKLKDKKRVRFSEENKIVNETAMVKLSNEIIADNSNKGFETVNNSKESIIKEFINKYKKKSKERYISEYRYPNVWRPTINSAYYGETIKSAHKIRSGKGEQFVRWNIDITQKGEYEVYAYSSDMVKRRRWGRRDKEKSKEKIEYTYKIFSDDGETEVKEDVNNKDNNWIYLGSFYFSKGKAKIELSDITNYDFVLADAIKLVRL